MKKALTLMLVLIFLTASSVIVSMPVKAQKVASININADGSVYPSTAPVQQEGHTYTLMDDFEGSILIQRSNIVFNGNNYSLSGGIVVIGDYNTITNTTIMHVNAPVEAFGSTTAIRLLSSHNNITGNYLSNNTIGINFASETIYATGRPPSKSKNNYVVGNTITDCYTALQFYSSQDNHIYHNNFINNNYTIADPGFIYYYPSKLSINVWDDGYGSGNFWDDYLTRYPNATESNTPGVGDTPYLIRPASYIDPANLPTQESKEYWTNMNTLYAQNVDHYPLIAPFGSENKTSGLPSDTGDFLTFPFAIIGIAVAIFAGVITLVLLLRRHRKTLTLQSRPTLFQRHGASIVLVY